MVGDFVNDPDEMNKVAEVYMAGEDSEKLRGAADVILSRWRYDRKSTDKGIVEHAKDFKAHVLKYRHAYEFLSQIIAYADADVSRRAMLCSVLEPNLHITELDDSEEFLTGVTLAGVAIAQGEVEENHSVTGGESEALQVPEFTVRLGEPQTPLRSAFDEAVEKVNDRRCLGAIFSGIEQRKQRDALVSSDKNVLDSLVDALANIMASAKETGQLES